MRLIVISFMVLVMGSLFAENQSLKTELAKPDTIVIDVRTKAEYEAGHLKNASHIPYENILERINEVTKNKSQKIYLYCGSGRRSGIAQEILLKAGYSNAINAGGYSDLKPE